MDSAEIRAALSSKLSQLLTWFLQFGRNGTSSNPIEPSPADSPLNGTTDTSVLEPAASSIFDRITDKDTAFLTAQVVLTSLLLIWLGAHGALRRPPSAAPRKGRTKKEAENERFTEGFVASDAIMFPILCGIVLVGLYYLIEWLRDVDVLNKILRSYMSLMSLATLGRLVADALQVSTSLVFPTFWRDGSGQILQIDAANRCQWLVESSVSDSSHRVQSQDHVTPFPGLLSKVKLSPSLNALAWRSRYLLEEEWALRLELRHIIKAKVGLKLNDILGYLLAVIATVAYYSTDLFFMSNLMGSALCYGAFIMMSPTSFGIGTLVLWGLFVYDIVMVFYTPYMITVATKIDAPIKLTFQGPSRKSMLGLGDIVIPGIFISLALRFDLWQFYEKKIKYVPVDLTTETKGEAPGQAITTTERQLKQIKAEYVNVQGRWGDRFWTTSWKGLFARAAPARPLVATAFPKTYFYASLGGYALGMLFTLAMLLVFEHGQPALLYLVPAVTGAVWATGLVRGELSQMWTYTEDGSLDTQDVVVEVDGNGQVIKEIPKEGAAGKESVQTEKNEATRPGPATKGKDAALLDDRAGSQAQTNADSKTHTHRAFVFSISPPQPSGVKRE